MFNEFEKDEFMLDDDEVETPKKKGMWDEDEEPSDGDLEDDGDDDADDDEDPVEEEI